MSRKNYLKKKNKTKQNKNKTKKTTDTVWPISSMMTYVLTISDCDTQHMFSSLFSIQWLCRCNLTILWVDFEADIDWINLIYQLSIHTCVCIYGIDLSRWCKRDDAKKTELKVQFSLYNIPSTASDLWTPQSFIDKIMRTHTHLLQQEATSV